MHKSQVLPQKLGLKPQVLSSLLPALVNILNQWQKTGHLIMMTVLLIHHTGQATSLPTVNAVCEDDVCLKNICIIAKHALTSTHSACRAHVTDIHALTAADLLEKFLGPSSAHVDGELVSADGALKRANPAQQETPWSRGQHAPRAQNSRAKQVI